MSASATATITHPRDGDPGSGGQTGWWSCCGRSSRGNSKTAARTVRRVFRRFRRGSPCPGRR
jgi:hypothetical protein